MAERWAALCESCLGTDCVPALPQQLLPQVTLLLCAPSQERSVALVLRSRLDALCFAHERCSVDEAAAAVETVWCVLSQQHAHAQSQHARSCRTTGVPDQNAAVSPTWREELPFDAVQLRLVGGGGATELCLEAFVRKKVSGADQTSIFTFVICPGIRSNKAIFCDCLRAVWLAVLSNAVNC